MQRLKVIVLIFCLLQFQAVSSANEFACRTAPNLYGTDPVWTTSGEKNLKFIVSWAFRDPENCIVGMSGPGERFGDSKFTYGSYPNQFEFPASWRVTRDGEMALVSAEIEFSLPLLLSLSNKNLDGYGLGIPLDNRDLKIVAGMKVRRGNGFDFELIRGEFGLTQLWGTWFSKSQGIYPENCELQNLTGFGFVPESKLSYSYKILEYGVRPKIEITISDPSDCIFLIHSGPLSPDKKLSKTDYWRYAKSLAEYPYWHPEAPTFFDSILKDPNKAIQVGLNLDVAPTPFEQGVFGALQTSISQVQNLPITQIPHSDSVARIGNLIKITTIIDTSGLALSPKDNVVLYLGTYRWFTKNPNYISGGWRVSVSGGTWTARYSSGFSIPGGITPSYYTKGISIPSTFLISAEQKVAVEKAAADKAAAELKEKQDVLAQQKQVLAQQKQDCLQYNIEVEKLFERFNQLKNLYPSNFESYFKGIKRLDLQDPYIFINSRIDRDCNWYEQTLYSFKGTKARWAQDLERDAGRIASLELALKPAKKTTITCVKGKLTKKVTAVKPVCPKGYKKK